VRVAVVSVPLTNCYTAATRIDGGCRSTTANWAVDSLFH
jgi:hypothetical protein